MQLLGEGSYSKVYLVRHKELSKLLVMKKRKRNALSGNQHQQEVQILKNLSYPGIPELYDYEMTDDEEVIVEEFIPGTSLHSILMQAISQEQFISYSLQMAALLFYMHSQESGPILYLDVKQEHFIVQNEQVHLIDYGLAAVTKEGRTNQILYGTKPYTAPEVIENQSATVESDIYSLGILFKEMFQKTKFRRYGNSKKVLLSMIDQMTQESPAARYQSLQPVIQTLSQLKRGNLDGHTTNLRTRIAVVGSQPRVGTTFTSVLLTSCLNQMGYSACYQETQKNRWIVRSSLHPSFRQEFEPVWKGKFRALPDYGAFVDNDDVKEVVFRKNDPEIIVEDLGVISPNLLLHTYEVVIVVLGARPWEEENSCQMAKDTEGLLSCMYVCSLQTKEEVQRLAGLIGKKIIHIPALSDPFRPGRRQSRALWRQLQEFVQSGKDYDKSGKG